MSKKKASNNIEELRKKLKLKKFREERLKKLQDELSNADKRFNKINPKNPTATPNRDPVKEVDWTCPDCKKVYRVVTPPLRVCNDCAIRKRGR